MNNIEYNIYIYKKSEIFAKCNRSVPKLSKMFRSKIKLKKTEIIPLGPHRLSPIDLPNKVDKLSINYGAFKTLDVWFSQNFDESLKLNYDERIIKIETLLQIWKQRSLSWKGRIMIIKTLILSQVTHLLSMVFTPSYILEKLDKIMFKFLWHDKQSQRSKLGFYVPFNSQGHIGTGPQNCHFWDSNPQR